MKFYISPVIGISYDTEDVLTASVPTGFEVKDLGGFEDEMDF